MRHPFLKILDHRRLSPGDEIASDSPTGQEALKAITKKDAPAGLGACQGIYGSDEMVVGFDRRGAVTKLRLTIC